MSESLIKGIIQSAELAELLSGVEIVLMDCDGAEKKRSESDSNGGWQISKPQAGDSLFFSKSGYISKTFTGTQIPEVVRLLDDRLIGYQDKLWFQPGENVSVYVHSSVSYKATLYRHGVKKVPVISFDRLSSSIQQIPDGFFVDSGINWKESFSYSIPVDVKPGLYSILLVDDNQSSFAIPMVVSTPCDNKTNNKLMVLASTSTWQAYNIWGGRSRYLNFEHCESDQQSKKPDTFSFKKLYIQFVRLVKKVLPNKLILLIRYYFNTSPEQALPWMFDRLSIRRPFTNCDLEGDKWDEPFINHLAGGEWRVLAWLERQGIEYNIMSCWELQNKPEMLKGNSALLISTHCEYWSCDMFKVVKQYHESNGLWIINLGGNTMFREIEHYDDGSLRLVSTSFKNSCSDETKLIGVRFTDLDYGTCAPYKAVDANHWVFDGADLNANANIFGENSLNRSISPINKRTNPGRPAQGGGLVGQGASGWETDKLSISAPKDFRLVAKGTNPDGGADMIVREPLSDRGGVFSASSIVFGGSLGVDPVCSKIVENVLSRCLKG